MLWLLTSTLGGAVLVTAAAWLWFRIANRHALQLCRAIPSAQPCFPLLGNVLTFACSQERMTENLLNTLEETVLKGHRAVCFWLGSYPIVFVNDPDDIKKILNNSLSRGKEIEESSKEYAKHGLLMTPVDHWKKTRGHLNPSFHPRLLEQRMPTFNFAGRQLVADLSGHVDGGEFDLMPHAMSASLSSICTFLYGPESVDHLLGEQGKTIRHGLELAAELMAVRLLIPWLRNDVLFKIFYGKEIDCVKKACEESFHIEQNVSGRKSLIGEEGDTTYEGGDFDRGFRSILDTMRDLQKKDVSITDDHVMDEMSSFFAAGTDSIGATVSSCLLALASFPHIQDKLYEEISSVVSDSGDEDISHMHLNRLTYLDNVIKETLRFFVITPFTSRMPTKDIDLGGYTIPANRSTILFLGSTSVNPKYFPDPHTFDPDHFAAAGSSSEKVFFPFSRGARNCIGSRYAMMLMKVMVAHVVRAYTLSTNMDIYNLKRRKYMITLTLCDGYNVFLRNRRK